MTEELTQNLLKIIMKKKKKSLIAYQNTLEHKTFSESLQLPYFKTNLILIKISLTSFYTKVVLPTVHRNQRFKHHLQASLTLSPLKLLTKTKPA